MSARHEKPKEFEEVPSGRDVPDEEDSAEMEAGKEIVKCPSCGYSFITKSNGKSKLRTRILVFAGNGNTMGICPKCKANLKVPVTIVTCSGSRGPAPRRSGNSAGESLVRKGRMETSDPQETAAGGGDSDKSL